MSSLPHIPLIYSAIFLTIEPFLALLGALQCYTAPNTFIKTFTLPPYPPLPPSLDLIFSYLAATYFLLAFNLAITLRATNELGVWKTSLLGVLLCDVLHLYGSMRSLGVKNFWNPGRWRTEDWMNLGLLWSTAILRVFFLAGVGIEDDGMGLGLL